MQNALLIGLSRQVVLERQMDVVANNLANINTNGFKAERSVFQEFLNTGAHEDDFQGRDRRVSFVQDRAAYHDFAGGPLEETKNPLDIAVDGFDHYQPADGSTLDLVRDAADYLPTLRRRLEALDPGALDLVLYNAGMDPSERCLIGGLQGITGAILAEREETVFAWAAANGLPVAFVLAGGYSTGALSEADLVDLHRLTLSAAARHGGR